MLVVVFYAITSFFSLQIGTWEEKNLNTWTNSRKRTSTNGIKGSFYASLDKMYHPLVDG
jgi:hypothetical protein